jgi:hypothetical protein
MFCLKQPIPALFEAAQMLDLAVDAHLEGDYIRAAQFIQQADMPEIRSWTESIWGIGGIYSKFKKQLGEPSTVPKELRDKLRMPSKAGEKQLLERDGHFCRFCRIPVIRKEVRVLLHRKYPNALPWGTKNEAQHAAFQAMWVQYDHLVPHARGGQTTLQNMVISCAPCNYGRMNYLVEEIGLVLNEYSTPYLTNWDGLERLLK